MVASLEEDTGHRWGAQSEAPVNVPCLSVFHFKTPGLLLFISACTGESWIKRYQLSTKGIKNMRNQPAEPGSRDLQY